MGKTGGRCQNIRCRAGLTGMYDMGKSIRENRWEDFFSAPVKRKTCVFFFHSHTRMKNTGGILPEPPKTCELNKNETVWQTVCHKLEKQVIIETGHKIFCEQYLFAVCGNNPLPVLLRIKKNTALSSYIKSEQKNCINAE